MYHNVHEAVQSNLKAYIEALKKKMGVKRTIKQYRVSTSADVHGQS